MEAAAAATFYLENIYALSIVRLSTNDLKNYFKKITIAQQSMNELMSDLYSRDNLTTAVATPGLLHEVAASFLKDTTSPSSVDCLHRSDLVERTPTMHNM